MAKEHFDGTGPARRIPFPAANSSYRAARMRCAIACRNYNNQNEDCSAEQRASLWRAIVSPHTSAPSSQLQPNSILGTASYDSGTNDDALACESHPADPCHINQRSLVETASKLHPSAPAPALSQLQSPPPSPDGPRPPLKSSQVQDGPSAHLLVNTPPSSRRASSPSASAQEISLSSENGEIAKSVPRGLAISNCASQESSCSNPFDVGVPYVKTPVFIDYGTTLKVAASSFINRNFTVIDSPATSFTIGEQCLIGPNVTLAGVGHPLDAAARAGPLGAPSLASDIIIGDRCWIGAGVMILGGVVVGEGCVIGAGSVVTRSIPAGHLAFGVPARVIRRVTPSMSDPAVSTVPCQDFESPSEYRASQIPALLDPFSYVPNIFEIGQLQTKLQNSKLVIRVLGVLFPLLLCQLLFLMSK